MEYIKSFQKAKDAETRKAEQKKQQLAHPDRVSIIVDRHDKNVSKCGKNRFLVPLDMSAGQFLYMIRKRLEEPLRETEALFFYLHPKGTMVPTADLMSKIQAEHKNPEDNFLYLVYAKENAFGHSLC